MNEVDSRPPLDLRAALRIVRTRWAWILVPIVLLTGLQLGRALRITPMYASSAELLLQGRTTDALLSGINDPNSIQNGYYAGRILATEIRVVESLALQERVSTELGFPASASGGGDPESSVLSITARDTSPRRAAEVANAYAAAYIELRREQSIRDIEDATKLLQARVAQYQRDIDALTAQLADPANAAPAVSSQLTQRRDALNRAKENFQNRIDGLTIDASLKSGGATILTPAYEPTVPYAPRPVRSAAIGMLAGLVLGLGLAFLRDLLDDRIRTREDLVALAPNLPILGLIPKMKRLTPGRMRKLGRHAHAVPPEAVESYRSLRSAITFLGVDQPLTVIQITSPHAGEGKSTTTRNLARMMSHSGHSVLVIDADMRKPSLHALAGLTNEVGLSNVLAGTLGIATAAKRLALDEDLTVLTAGPVPPNPSELLGSRRGEELIDAVRGHYDVVLIDGPPVLAVTDPVVIAHLVDATVVVTKADSSRRDDLARALEILGQSKANVVGLVLNGIDTRSRYGRYVYGRYGAGGYGYGYGSRRARPAVVMPRATTLPVWVPEDDPVWTTSEGDPAWLPNGADLATSRHPAAVAARTSKAPSSAAADESPAAPVDRSDDAPTSETPQQLRWPVPAAPPVPPASAPGNDLAATTAAPDHAGHPVDVVVPDDPRELTGEFPRRPLG
jgi:capsular exopolysaccharide synthesis family protein